MTGHTLNNVLLEQWPFAMEDEDGVWTGIFPEVLSVLRSVMGFEVEFFRPEDGKWGSMEQNGTWNGIVGCLENGEADIRDMLLFLFPSRLICRNPSKPWEPAPANMAFSVVVEIRTRNENRSLISTTSLSLSQERAEFIGFTDPIVLDERTLVEAEEKEKEVKRILRAIHFKIN